MMRTALEIWILSAVVCLGRSDHHEDHHSHSHVKGHEHHHTEPDNSARSVSLVTSANKDFAYSLYKKLAAQVDSQGKNIFFSPISVTTALAALSVGAREETHRQLFDGLGFNSSLLTQTDVDHAFHTLLSGPNTTSQEDMSAGTAVFVHDTFKPRPEFLEVLKQSYLADGFTVDFNKTTESADIINRYVGEKTNGKIDKLVENLDPSTVMYLISYIYYKGKWETPFDPKDTREEDFHVDEQNKVPVQMMNLEETFSFYYDQGISTSVLRLPFNNSNSMLLLLPDKDLAGLEDAICQSHVTKWLKWMKPRENKVFLPKFSIKTSYSLNDVLSGMGMADMFGAAADFSGISEGQKLAVSEVVHQASLDVDEAGATAAAATGVGFMPLSLHIVPALRFDRPFMVLIIEPTTESILFMGKIVNPNI
ncbi:serpin A3-2-like [Centroberyx affinis]|uniref:serpin A3-2-like n=1 Tax=Centroberyx affinis TaxID=166261 RepID=UPI003A5C2C12